MNAIIATEARKVPAWFRGLAALGLIWNLFGVAMYLQSVGVFGDPLTGLSTKERAFAEAVPGWATGAFAIGTIAGLLGSTGLLLGKRWAWPMLLLSLVALVVLEGWVVFLSGALEVHGIAVPIAVTAGAALLAWMAHKGRECGWLG